MLHQSFKREGRECREIGAILEKYGTEIRGRLETEKDPSKANKVLRNKKK